MGGLDKTLAIMFSVPFNYVLRSNWWNVAIFDGRREADSAMFRDMYYRLDPFKGNNAWYTRRIRIPGGIEIIKGAMTTSGTATLSIQVKHSKH